MITNDFIRWALIVLALAGSVAHAQQRSQAPGDYPNKPIRIVTAAPGGGNDLIARTVAQGISGPLGQQVVVDNRGGGVIAGEIVSKAPRDGYTLLVTGSDFWIGPLVRKTAFDPVKDFSPVSFTTSAPNIVVVHPSVPAKSIKELIDLAKAKPGELNYASAGIGASQHLGGELFKVMAGVNIVHVPYQAAGPSIIAIVGNQVQLTFATAASVATPIKSGALRALAVTSAKPSALFPGLPTVAATIPGYEIRGAQAVFAPVGTPATVITRLNREVVRAFNQPEVKERMFNAGLEVVASSPEELMTTMKSEMARLGKVIKDAGIRDD